MFLKVCGWECSSRAAFQSSRCSKGEHSSPPNRVSRPQKGSIANPGSWETSVGASTLLFQRWRLFCEKIALPCKRWMCMASLVFLCYFFLRMRFCGLITVIIVWFANQTWWKWSAWRSIRYPASTICCIGVSCFTPFQLRRFSISTFLQRVQNSVAL